MIQAKAARLALGGALVLTLASCGALGTGGQQSEASATGNARFASVEDRPVTMTRREAEARQKSGTILGLFSSRSPDVSVEVNKYLWQASLEVLDFLPVETVDPFTGVIVTGYGRPPGGARAYRATIYVQDPALEARSLRLSLQSQGGTPVSAETTRAVEDAIMTRARQLRIRDSRL